MSSAKRKGFPTFPFLRVTYDKIRYIRNINNKLRFFNKKQNKTIMMYSNNGFLSYRNLKCILPGRFCFLFRLSWLILPWKKKWTTEIKMCNIYQSFLNTTVIFYIKHWRYYILYNILICFVPNIYKTNKFLYVKNVYYVFVLF